MAKSICAAEGCSSLANARGFCPKHYGRWMRTGTLTADIKPHDPIEVRFWRLVDRKGDGECWAWLGTSTRGYGFFRVGDSSRPAHRLAYEWARGPIPLGLQLDHLCRNPSCVNPAHLEPVSGAENVQRERKARGACPKGHPYDDAHTSVWGGRRYCRVCRNEHRRTGERRTRTGAVVERTECRNGHAMVEPNARRTPSGKLACRQCERDRHGVQHPVV